MTVLGRKIARLKRLQTKVSRGDMEALRAIEMLVTTSPSLREYLAERQKTRPITGPKQAKSSAFTGQQPTSMFIYKK